MTVIGNCELCQEYRELDVYGLCKACQKECI